MRAQIHVLCRVDRVVCTFLFFKRRGGGGVLREIMTLQPNFFSTIKFKKLKIVPLVGCVLFQPLPNGSVVYQHVFDCCSSDCSLAATNVAENGQETEDDDGLRGLAETSQQIRRRGGKATQRATQGKQEVQQRNRGNISCNWKINNAIFLFIYASDPFFKEFTFGMQVCKSLADS